MVGALRRLPTLSFQRLATDAALGKTGDITLRQHRFIALNNALTGSNAER